MEKITIRPEMLEHQGLRIDLHEIAGWIDLESWIENEHEMILENILDYEDLGLSGRQWDLIVERVIGEDLDPYNVIDFEKLISEMYEYAIQAFLDTAELHGVIDLALCDPELLSHRELFLTGRDPFTVELWIKPDELYKVWLETVGGSVEIDRSRYGRHRAYTEDQAVVIEVLREIFEGKNNAISNSSLLEDFTANHCLSDFMRMDRYDLLKEIVAPDLT